VPSWVRLIFKDSSLSMHEEAWNAYPYCKTVLTNPYMKENMIIDIATLHVPDRGESENVHQLPPDELKKNVMLFILILLTKLVDMIINQKMIQKNLNQLKLVVVHFYIMNHGLKPVNHICVVTNW